MTRVMTDDGTAPRATVPCPFCGTLNRVRVDRVEHRPTCGACQKPLLLDRPVKVTDDSFDAVVLGTDVPVLVDFYADWCGPCRMLAPTLDEIAWERRGAALVVKLDTDANPKTAQRFAIRSIPALKVFRAGQVVQEVVGVVPKATLLQALNAATASP